MTYWEYLKTLDADSAAMYILSNLPKPDVRFIGRKYSINGDAFKYWLNSKILYHTSDGDYIDMFELLGDDAAFKIAGLKKPTESECSDMTPEQALQNVLCGKAIPYKKKTKDTLSRVVEDNKKLKQLLKAAVDDIGFLLSCDALYNRECDKCKYDDASFDDSECINCENAKWIHYDEAMKLIKGD